MKDITKISDNLAGSIDGTDLTYIGKPDYEIWYYSTSPSNATIAYITPLISYGNGGYRHCFSSQGNTFNTIFNDNISRYKEAIKDISDLKRENVIIAMRRDN